jgi:signal transduction histidine kinase
MLRQRDRLLPAAAFLVLFAIGVLVLVLVTNAVDSGRTALEDAVLSEVQATARSQAAGLGSQLQGINSFLTGRDLELDVGSEADEQAFAEVASLLEETDLRTGFFLTNADGVVTQGFLLDDRSVIGQPYERPGLAALLEVMASEPSEGQQPLGGWFLPMAPGITTAAPTIGAVGAIRSRDDTFRGTFVFESEVAADSQLSTEIRQLSRGETGEFLVLDDSNRVVAASNPSLVAEEAPDPAFGELPEGVHRRDGQVQVLGDVSPFQWRVVFTQDADEFDEGLAGPLQQVGIIVVVAFIAIGVLTFIALARRLQAAREEEERLRRLSESQEEFISIVSHELRTPVAGVLGFLQTTMDHWDSMSETERFNAVRRSASNARRLQGLTRDVLDSQSVESGRMSYAMGDADLREEVAVAVEAATALYPRLTIETSLEADPVPVVVDVDRIQQVLTNLIDNAAKVSPPDGVVAVRMWREGERACVSVTDQGPGLSPEVHDRVFDKFVRGRESTVTGTGLGLYISRQILLAHDGSISVDTGAEGGATFTFDLPVAAAKVPH